MGTPVHKHTNNTGFTIVELLIVIIVIGILAALVLVAYSNVTDQAKASAAKNDLEQVAKQLNTYKEQTGNGLTYPSDASALTYSSGTTIQYSVNNGSNPATYCVSATNGGKKYFASNTSQSPTAGSCTITNVATNPHALASGGAWTNQTPSGGTTSYVANGAQDGGSAFKIVTTNAGQLRIALPTTIGAVAANEVISGAMDIYAPVAMTGYFELGIDWSTYVHSASQSLVAGWNRVVAPITAPVSGSGVLFQFVCDSSCVSSGQTILASRGTVVRGSYGGTYADGSTSGWSWSGTANNSASSGPAL